MSDQSVIRTSKELVERLRVWVRHLERSGVRNSSTRERMSADLIAAIAALEPTTSETCDAWLPIETAPKDEKPILLGCPAIGAMKDPGSTRVFEGRWNDAQQTWTSMNGFLLLTVATHWMPLPEPPSEKASE